MKKSLAVAVVPEGQKPHWVSSKYWSKWCSSCGQKQDPIIVLKLQENITICRGCADSLSGMLKTAVIQSRRMVHQGDCKGNVGHHEEDLLVRNLTQPQRKSLQYLKRYQPAHLEEMDLRTLRALNRKGLINQEGVEVQLSEKGSRIVQTLQT